MLRRLLVFLAFVSIALVPASPAAAHNTLLSSDPADGAALTELPTQMTLVFDKSVPLDTLSIELIDATGVRTTLSGSTHGASGDTVVVTPLPALTPGEVTTRWRLVGPDGHTITGRVSFTIRASVTTTIEATSATAQPGVGPATTQPPSLSSANGGAGATGAVDLGFGEPWSTPSTLRWLFRLLSYLAIMTVGGVLATTAFVWKRAWSHPSLQRLAACALVIAIVLAIAQLLVIASDIRAEPPWRALAGLSAAFETDAGIALALRVMLIVGLTWVMFFMHATDEWNRWIAAGGCTLLLLATWAYAGHSRSMRWSLIGIPVDVAHHAAAAAWIGGLAIVGIVAIRDTEADEMVDIVQRFARLAATSVAVIVGTGAIQALRLVGSPSRLFAADHGRYLLLKLAIMGIMLKVADVNRQRVNRRFRDARTATPHVVYNLRRAMGTELAVGLGVIAITAAMVVSPPAVAQESASSIATMSALPGSTVSITTTTLAQPVTAVLANQRSPGSSASAVCLIAGTLVSGSTGDDVTCLQQALIVQSLLEGSPSGAFDAATDQAVRTFQFERSLLADGIVGPVTAAALGIWATS